MIPDPKPLTWEVYSRNGIHAVAWPINSEAAPGATGAAPDPTKEIQLVTSIPPLPADAERTEEVDALSGGDCAFIAARLADHYPEIFDALLLALKRWPTGLEEVTH